MLHVVEKQAKDAAAAAETAHGVFHKARRAKDAASEALTKAAEAKAAIEAEEKKRRERRELAATFDSSAKNAFEADDAFEAAETDRSAKVDASEAAKAEAATVRNSYAYADYILAVSIAKLLGDGEITEAELLAKLPADIEAERDKQLDRRMAGLSGGGGAPLTAYDKVHDQVDWWIDQLRSDGLLVSIYYRTGETWRAHPLVKDMIAKAKGLIFLGPDALKQEAKAYLRGKHPVTYEPIPPE